MIPRCVQMIASRKVDGTPDPEGTVIAQLFVWVLVTVRNGSLPSAW
jgi:hypothetical protein